jgi:hypothetical protein
MTSLKNVFCHGWEFFALLSCRSTPTHRPWEGRKFWLNSMRRTVHAWVLLRCFSHRLMGRQCHKVVKMFPARWKCSSGLPLGPEPINTVFSGLFPGLFSGKVFYGIF